jgi:ribonuclease D
MPSRPQETVETPDQLAVFCSHLRAAERFAFDTEFVTEDTFTPVLCIVQVASADRLAIIDALAVGDLAPFWSIVADPPGQVVAHAADAEIRFCQQCTERDAAAIFDVQIAAGLAGYGYPLSYSMLVKRVLGKEVRGGETRTEWRRRPLTPKQLQYALEDVRYLLAVHQKLVDDLRGLGRLSWAEAEFRARVVPPERAGEPWLRVSGMTSLNRRQLAVLRELARWRDDEAKRRDRPVRSIAADDLIRELAKRQPSDLRDMVMFRGMNRRKLMRVAPELIAAIQRGMAVPDAECPSPPRKPDDSDRVRMLTGVLSTAVACVAARERVPAAMLASSGELASLVRGYLARGAIPDDSPLAHGWRNELCGRLLVDLLCGKLCLRAADLSADMPLVIERHGPDQ